VRFSAIAAHRTDVAVELAARVAAERKSAARLW